MGMEGVPRYHSNYVWFMVNVLWSHHEKHESPAWKGGQWQIRDSLAGGGGEGAQVRQFCDI